MLQIGYLLDYLCMLFGFFHLGSVSVCSVIMHSPSKCQAKDNPLDVYVNMCFSVDNIHENSLCNIAYNLIWNKHYENKKMEL